MLTIKCHFSFLGIFQSFKRVFNEAKGFQQGVKFLRAAFGLMERTGSNRLEVEKPGKVKVYTNGEGSGLSAFQ